MGFDSSQGADERGKKNTPQKDAKIFSFVKISLSSS